MNVLVFVCQNVELGELIWVALKGKRFEISERDGWWEEVTVG